MVKHYQQRLNELKFLHEARLPSTRYQGSKEKIVEWIWGNIEHLEFDSFLDAFGGTGSVGFWAKKHGKQVFYNDVFRSNFFIGLALIENDTITLSEDDVKFILTKHNFDYPTFIQDTFKGIYYTDEENVWLDMIIRNVEEIKSLHKRALALSALFQACLVKRPYNLFHRANLYMRLADVERGFGNKATWDTPFPVHFKKFINEYNSAVFSNGLENKAFNLDVFAVPNPEKYDLVYIDTPYFSEIRGPTDYYFYYHFLEGLCIYLEKGAKEWSSLIDYNRKPKPLRHNIILERKTSPWTKANLVCDAFDSVFRKFKESILIVSYNSEGIPSERQMLDLLKRYKKDVKVRRKEYRYALRPGRLDELLFIAT